MVNYNFSRKRRVTNFRARNASISAWPVVEAAHRAFFTSPGRLMDDRDRVIIPRVVHERTEWRMKVEPRADYIIVGADQPAASSPTV